MSNDAKYARYKANVPRRRTTLWWLLISAAIVFLISLADIIWWNEVLQYGLYAAYVILFIWAIVLLFAAVVRHAWDMGEVVLACPNCDHAFLYAADHADNKGHARMSCPVCGHAGDLPVSEDQSTEIDMPSGARHDMGYHCTHCEEHIVISTLGDTPRQVAFEVCPHCGEHGTVQATELPDEVSRRRQDFWSSA